MILVLFCFRKINKEILHVSDHLAKSKSEKLTARGHHQGEEHHSPGRWIQAASLISGGPPVGLQGQTWMQAHFATHCSCWIWLYPVTYQRTLTCKPVNNYTVNIHDSTCLRLLEDCIHNGETIESKNTPKIWKLNIQVFHTSHHKASGNENQLKSENGKLP